MSRGKSPHVSNKKRESFIPGTDLEETKAQISQNDQNTQKKKVVIVDQP